MSENSANLKNIFWPQKHPLLTLEVGIFSDWKRYSQIFENWQKKIHPKFISIKKIREPFLSGQEGGHELPPLCGVCQASGVVVRCARLRCTRLQHRTCKTSRVHFASHGISAHGLKHRTYKTNRRHFASLAVSKVPATPWDFDFLFTKKVPATCWDFYFFFPILRVEVRFFYDRIRFFLQNG